MDVGHENVAALNASVAQAVPIEKARHASTVRRRRTGLLAIAAVIAVGVAVGLYLLRPWEVREARVVRSAFAAGKIADAREPLKHWLAVEPGSGEAQYYRAWAALAADQPGEASDALDQARKLGFDRTLLEPLTAIGQSRSRRYSEAEPALTWALGEQLPPRDLVAMELARIYLSTYRLEQAAQAIERWRNLAPDDPQPYLWTNEVLARSDVEPTIPIQNFRAALERDPSLDKARLGLAQQLSKARRFEEAEQEFQAYLKRVPNDAVALLGLGRNAFQQGGIEAARDHFEQALKSNPRQPEALKELSQIDMRLGRYSQAIASLERLITIDPFDHEVRYSYAQALKLAGESERAARELEQAGRLRKEHEELVSLRTVLIKDPSNVGVRFKVAQWMFGHGHEDEGMKWTTEILRAEPRHVPTHKLLADYYTKRGDAGLANYHRAMASAGIDEGSAASANASKPPGS